MCEMAHIASHDFELCRIVIAALGAVSDLALTGNRNVRFWPIADMPSCTAHVCFRG
jgi:hypothetical protein